MDIKNILEVLDFALCLGEGFAKSLEDKKITSTDLVNFFPAIMAIPAAFEGIDQVVPEVKEFSEDETKQIKDLVVTRLCHIAGIEEKWLVLAQEAFCLGLSIMKIISAFKAPKEEVPAV